MIGHEMGSVATPAPVATIDSQGDDHDQAVPLGEMARGVQSPPRRAGQHRACVVRHDGGHPGERLRLPIELRSHQQQHCAHEQRREEPEQLTAQARIVGARQPEDRQVQQTQRQVGDRDDDRPGQATRAIFERFGYRHGQHEHRGHRAEHRHTAEAFIGAQHVPHPGETDPTPPEEAKHQQAAEQAVDREVVRHQGGDLREREDEHQVEEQLDRSDPCVLRDRLDARMARRAHGVLKVLKLHRDAPAARCGRRPPAGSFVMNRCRAALSGCRRGARRGARRR